MGKKLTKEVNFLKKRASVAFDTLEARLS